MTREALSPIPFPPSAVARVPFSDPGADLFQVYEEQGRETKSTLLRLLPEDWSFEGKRVLDFGCGGGRTLRHFLTEAETAEIWGVDVDEASIEWLENELSPPLHVKRSPIDPPLGLPYGSFDLIWAISVFTHLPGNSIPWLVELHRLLKPGGYLIATYMGRWNSEFIADEPWDEDRVGMNVLQHYQPWFIGGPSVLISEWWMREHWGRAFDVLDIVEPVHNQSWPLLRKRDVEVTVEDIERLSDDPRDLAALRHNLEQVRAELDHTLERRTSDLLCILDAALDAQHNKRREDDLRMVRSIYEQSLSWRVTRPLRSASSKLRSLQGRRSG